MRKALLSLLLLAALVAAAGCGDDDAETGALGALPSSSCEPIEYDGEGEPDVLIASDLPMQGDSKERSDQQVEAIKLALERRDWRAGDKRVAFQACDDSTAKAGEWTEAKCKANAKAYSENGDVVGVLGTYNSGCAALIIPVLNRAPGDGLAMVSPGNTLICLTESSNTCEGGQPDSLYPEKKRNYARVVPNDAFQGAGLATFAKDRKLKKVFVLYAADDATSLGQAETFRNSAKPLGLDVAGFEKWDPKAKSRRRRRPVPTASCWPASRSSTGAG